MAQKICTSAALRRNLRASGSSRSRRHRRTTITTIGTRPRYPRRTGGECRPPRRGSRTRGRGTSRRPRRAATPGGRSCSWTYDDGESCVHEPDIPSGYGKREHVTRARGVVRRARRGLRRTLRRPRHWMKAFHSTPFPMIHSILFELNTVVSRALLEGSYFSCAMKP